MVVFFDDVDGAVSYFEGGNGSCDCNRENLFRKAIGLPLLGLSELVCSEGRFLIQMTSDTGKPLLSEAIVEGVVHRTVEE